MPTIDLTLFNGEHRAVNAIQVNAIGNRDDSAVVYLNPAGTILKLETVDNQDGVANACIANGVPMFSVTSDNISLYINAFTLVGFAGYPKTQCFTTGNSPKLKQFYIDNTIIDAVSIFQATTGLTMAKFSNIYGIGLAFNPIQIAGIEPISGGNATALFTSANSIENPFNLKIKYAAAKAILDSLL